MKRIVQWIGCWLLVLGSVGAWGQFSTPTIDANWDGIGNYPTNAVSGTSTWYLTWNNTDLFVFLQNANETEPVSIFLDVDPIVPVNGGTNANGTLVGINYDGYTGPPNLPIRADILIYAHNGYREIFRRNGSGGWTSLGGGNDGICGGGTNDYTGNANGQYSSNNNGNGAGGDDRREFRISWSRLLGAINGGVRPTSFNWFGYVSYNNGMYAQVPTENYNGNNVNSNNNGLVRYYTVNSTANGSSTNPFSRNSYTHPPGVDNNSFGAITVWDFTMNSPSRTITRTAGAGAAWVINNSLVLNDGTLSFGTSSTTANIGSLNQSGGILTLSGSAGGDLYLNGDFGKSGGTFNCNSRQVRFTGSANQGYTSNTTENINFIRNAKTGGILSINSSINLPVSGNTAEFDANTNTTFASGTTVTLSSGTTFTANNAGSTVTINGTIDNSGTVTGSSATLTFSSTGIYNHNLNGGAIPFATWNISSNCNVNGMAANAPTASSFAQDFGNLTWNSLGQTGIANFTGNLSSIAGNLVIQSTGTNVFRLNTNTPASVILNIGGNFTQNGGTTEFTNGASLVTVNVAGSFLQSGGVLNATIGSSGTGILNVTGNFSQTAGTINLGNGSSGTGILRVAGSFTQSIAGIIDETSSSVNHTIEFNGTSNQNINIAGTINNRINYRSNNSNGITLLTNLTINQDATFFRSRGSIAGTINYNNTNSTLSYDGESLTTSDVEWPATNGPTNVTMNTADPTNVITLSNPRIVSGILALTNGRLDIGNHDLTISNTAVAAINWIGNDNSFVSQTGTGQLIRALLGSSNQTYNFPIGVPGGLTNLTYFSVNNSFAGRLVGFRTVTGPSPNINTPNTPPDLLNRYWVSSVSPTTGTYTYRFSIMRYLAGEAQGTENNINISSFLAGSWSDRETTSRNPLASTTAAGNYTQASAPLDGGHFSGRNSSALYTWTGATNSSWATATNWLPNGFPSPTDRVLIDVPGTNPLLIGDDRTINQLTLTGSGTLTIQSTGILRTSNLVLDAPAALTMNSGAELRLTGSVAYTGTPTASLDCNSTVFYEGAGVQNIIPLQYGNLNAVGGNRNFANGATTSICGVYTRSAGTTTLTGSTVVYNGSTEQVIQSHTYVNLTINNSAIGFSTLEGNIAVSGTWVLMAGTNLDTEGRNVNLANSTGIVNGTWRRSGGTITQTSSTLTIGNTGVYEHNFTTLQGVIPTATWSPGSLCHIIGYADAPTLNAAGGWGQNFHHFTWNCSNQLATSNLNLVGVLATINGNFTIQSTGLGSLIYNTNTPALPTLTIGGNFLIANGIFRPNNGTSTPSINIRGNFEVSPTATFNNTGSGLVTVNFDGSINQQINIADPARVISNISFRLNNPAGITIPNGSTLPINANATFFRRNGAVTLAGSGNIAYNAAATLEYDPEGSTGLTTSNAEWPATGINRVRINSTSSNAITLHAPREIPSASGGLLTFTAGRLALGSHNLTVLDNAVATIVASGGYVETNGSGQLLRAILTSAGPHNYVFPVGNGAAYTPLTLSFTTNSVSGRQVGVRSVGAIHPNMAPNPTDFLNNRYWVTTLSDASGTYTYTPTFGFVAGDIVGSDANVRLSRWNGSVWGTINASTAGATSITATAALTQVTGSLAGGEWSGRPLKLPIDYTWSLAGSGSWTTTTNWTPNGVPTSEDIVRFAHTGNYTVSNVPTGISLRNLLVTNTGTTTLTTTSAGVLALGGGTNPAFSVAAGSSLIISGTQTINTIIATGATGAVAGNVQLRAEGSVVNHTLEATDAGALVFANGSYFTGGSTANTNFAGSPFGSSGATNRVIFESGSTFEQITGGNAFGLSQPNSKVVFNPGSTYRYSDNRPGVAFQPSISGRTYGHFEFNSTQNRNPEAGSGVWSMQNLTVVNSGNFSIDLAINGTITGDISVVGGSTLSFSPSSGSPVISLSGSTAQGISGAGNILVGPNATMSINNATGVTISNNMVVNGAMQVQSGALCAIQGEIAITGSGAFNLLSGGILSLGSASGLHSSGANGNIRTGTRSFHSAATLRYAGTASQSTGNFITIPTANTLAGLQINNPATVTLAAANNGLTVTNLALNTGILETGVGQNLNVAASGTIAATSGNLASGSAAGTIQFLGTGVVNATGSLDFWNVNLPAGSGGVNFGAAGSPTVYNELVISNGRFVNTNAPFYANTSTLVYNTGNTFIAGSEWYAVFTSGRGIPHHVQIGRTGVNSSVLSFGASSSSRYATGNITIGHANAGTGYGLTLSSNSGGDVLLEGNWLRFANGTFNTNNRAVFFTGNGNTQTITVNGGGTETFAYFIENKPAGNVQLAANTNVTVNGNIGGNNLQLLSGNLDLNGRTFEWGGSGNLQTDGAVREIFSATPATFRVTGGDRAVQPTNGGTLRFDNQTVVEIAAGLDFAANTTTINATLQINTGGFVNGNAPIYGPEGRLIYNTGFPYLRRVEWSGAIGQPGNPNDVIIRNGTTLLAAGPQRFPFTTPPSGEYDNRVFEARRDVTIESGSTLNMVNDYPMVASLVVGRDLRIEGTLIGSTTNGSDIYVGRNWFRSGTFTHNSRAVILNTNQDATISTSSGSQSFHTLIVDKANGMDNTVTLNAPVVVEQRLILTSGRMNTTDANILTVTNTTPDDVNNGIVYDVANDAYINGPVARAVQNTTTGTYVMPVGQLDGATHVKKRFLISAVADASGSPVFYGRYNHSHPPNQFTGSWLFQDILKGIQANGYWSFRPTTGDARTRIVLPYVPPAPNGWLFMDKSPVTILANANVAVVKGEDIGGGSFNYNYTAQFDPIFSNIGTAPEARFHETSGDVSSRWIDSYSPFTLGWGLNEVLVLPVTLHSFTATLQGGDGLLRWEIDDAKDLRHFELQHSTDGQRFATLATLPRQEATGYSYRHRMLSAGVHHYRLAIVEKDGRRHYSRIEMLQVGTQRTLISGLLHNPVVGGQAIVRLQSATAQSAQAVVIDMAGRVLLRQQVQLMAGANQVPLSMLPLPAGHYRLLFRTADGVEKVMPLLR